MMTLPQIVAVLEADSRRQIEDSLRLSSVVWAGVAPTVSKEGYRAASKWKTSLLKQLQGS